MKKIIITKSSRSEAEEAITQLIAEGWEMKNEITCTFGGYFRCVMIDEEKSEYPKLMQSVWTGDIVYFTAYGLGFVVHRDKGPHKIGYEHRSWAMNCFADYDGEVTLSNKQIGDA